MEVEGAVAPTPPTPLAQSHLQKMQELADLQEAYQQCLMEKGENHIQTKALAMGIKNHGPQASQIKTLSTQSSLQQVLLNGTKNLTAMKEAKEQEDKAWEVQIKDLQAKIDQMEKQREERAKEHNTAIQY
eukprot:4411992-Karenia_brevis.AAC.1